MAGVVFRGNRSLVNVTTEQPIEMVTSNAGAAVFLATGNVFRNNTATAMMTLNDCPIGDFSSFANAKGTIGAEVSGASGATIRNEILFDDSGTTIASSVGKVGFFGGTPRVKQAITAVTVEQLRDALVQYGLITDNS